MKTFTPRTHDELVSFLINNGRLFVSTGKPVDYHYACANNRLLVMRVASNVVAENIPEFNLAVEGVVDLSVLFPTGLKHDTSSHLFHVAPEGEQSSSPG